MSDNIIQFGNARADHEKLQRAAVAFIEAFNTFSAAIEALPDDNAHKSHWDYLDWHSSCAGGVTEVAYSIALDREHAQWNWTVTFCDKRDRTRKMGTMKLAALTSAQASDMAHKMAAGRGWELERHNRTSPIPDFAKHLVTAEDV